MNDAELIRALRLQSEHVPAFTIFDEAAERIGQAAIEKARVQSALKLLVQICEITRDGAGFFKGHYQHQITDTQWSAWCKQVKVTRALLKEIEANDERLD
jgi:hypothetical protein